MGRVLAGYFTPNASYVMQDHDDNHDTSQVRAMARIADEIAELDPDTVVVVSPHWQPRSTFLVEDSAWLHNVNDYPLLPQPFGRRYFEYQAPGDPTLAHAIIAAAHAAGLPARASEYGLDHGAFTALHVMENNRPVAPVSTSFRPHAECHRWGRAIRQAVLQSDRDVVALFPGNLSHRLDLRKDTEQEDYDARCADFDKVALELIQAGQYQSLHEMIEPKLVAAATPETGLRTFSILHGLMDGAPGDLIDYKGYKFGVGDATVRFVA